MIKNQYETTGIYAVDLVANAVSHYRHFRKPVKTIYLRPIVFFQFLAFVNMNLEKQEQEANEESKLEFDGVSIKMGSRYQKEPLMCEFYDEFVLN